MSSFLKKMIIIIACLFFFFVGVNSNNSISSSSLFENQKRNFEENISKENNDYNPVLLTYEEHFVSKVAHKIDKGINKAIEKFKKIIKNI